MSNTDTDQMLTGLILRTQATQAELGKVLLDLETWYRDAAQVMGQLDKLKTALIEAKGALNIDNQAGE
jgi:hypothetical protein